MSDNKFIPGLIVKAPHERAPEYVKAKLSIKREELLRWLGEQDGEWINADVKVSQNGKWYASIDDWKPEQRGNSGGGTSHRQQRDTGRSQAQRPPQDEEDELPPF